MANSPINLPDSKEKLVPKALEIIAECRVSAGHRAAQAKMIDMIIDSGRADPTGPPSKIPLLYGHLDRTASMLFSPSSLRFSIDYESEYDEKTIERGNVAARVVTRGFERWSADMTFSQGVFTALKYGSTILKQWVEQADDEKLPILRNSLVMPWQFGVYREDMNDLDRQPAMCESFLLTMPEVWRRIYHLPNAEKLFERIKSHAEKGQGANEYLGAFHNVLSTSTLQNTSQTAMRPGGIVSMSGMNTYGSQGPHVAPPMVIMHELWVQEENDYVTIQIIEPDILIAPIFKKTNLLVPGGDTGLHPYGFIQPNITHGNIWGRPEIYDMIQMQNWLSTTVDDTERLLGIQFDKFLGYNGDEIPDEKYAQMRQGGTFNVSAGANITDLTPKFPPEALPMIQMQIGLLENIGGFDNMLSGKGESGVRSGSQAAQLMKTSTPRMRDRSLLVERQCAEAGDLMLSLMQAKDGRNYWTDPNKPQETSFLLGDLPDDRRVVVAQHSASPIFQDDHQQAIAYGVSRGFIDGHSAIELMNMPSKDMLQRRLKDKEIAQAKQMADLKQSDPEAYAKLLEKQGGRHR